MVQGAMPAMYVVQHGNNLVANVGKPGLVLQQQGMHVGNQAWLQTPGAQVSGMFSAAGPTTAGQVAMYQQQPQQLRMAQVPVSTPPLPQQQQQVLLGGQQMTAPQQAGPQVLTAAAAADAHKQVVYVNINGALQRGIVHNGAVYLLANDTAGPGAHTAGHMHQATAGQVLTLQQQSQQQQQVMVQQVLPTGQLVPMSGALVASSAGVQLPTALQLQPQAQRPMAGPVPPMSMGLTPQVQQQPVVVMNTGMGPNMSVPRAHAPVSAAGLTPAAVTMHARPQQQQQQMLLPVAQTGARGPVAGPTAVRPASNSQFPGLTGATLRPTVISGIHTNLSANAVSANTASLMPRMAANTAAAVQQGMRPAPAGSQPMTIAAALAALPSHSSAAGAAAPAASSDLSSPVAPPGTPGMANGVAARSNAAGTIGAVIGKLANPSALVAGGQAGGVGGTVLASSTPAGSSPMTSQPGTPSRSNSVGANSSSGSSSSSFQLPAPDAANSTQDAEGKMAVMRMFARTFVETGIGLEQALNMIQPADRDLLAAAFAAEAAAACGASLLSKATDGVTGSAASSGGASGKTAATQSGLADLGGEQISMPLSEGRASGLEQLANLSGGASFDGTQDTAPGLDTFSLGSWGFSLFSNVASDLGSDRGASSFGGTGGLSGKVAAASMVAANGAALGDDSTATLFANLNL